MRSFLEETTLAQIEYKRYILEKERWDMKKSMIYMVGKGNIDDVAGTAPMPIVNMDLENWDIPYAQPEILTDEEAIELVDRIGW